MVGLMAEKTKQYLLVVVEFDASLLTDALPYTAIPDEIGAVLDDLTHAGALDTKMVYLLDEVQKNVLTMVINHNSLPYPALLEAAASSAVAVAVDDAAPTAVVVNLHDRRRRAQDLGGDPRTL